MSKRTNAFKTSCSAWLTHLEKIQTNKREQKGTFFFPQAIVSLFDWFLTILLRKLPSLPANAINIRQYYFKKLFYKLSALKVYLSSLCWGETFYFILFYVHWWTVAKKKVIGLQLLLVTASPACICSFLKCQAHSLAGYCQSRLSNNRQKALTLS